MVTEKSLVSQVVAPSLHHEGGGVQVLAVLNPVAGGEGEGGGGGDGAGGGGL